MEKQHTKPMGSCKSSTHTEVSSNQCLYQKTSQKPKTKNRNISNKWLIVAPQGTRNTRTNQIQNWQKESHRTQSTNK